MANRQRLASTGTKLSIEQLETRHMLAAQFFAPTEPSGSVNVQLVPLANVTAGTQEIVTFGVPFTRGSLTQTQLSHVRVLKNGVEIPAFVEQLTPWRSIDDAAIDGQSVRVARVQVPYTFTSLSPETITVEWGGAPRTLNRPTLQDPRLEWHSVTSGTFVAADNVEEPDVLPVLPKEYLSKGMLDAPTNPTANTVAETRDDPATMDTMTFTGYTEYDYAQKNFFYTIINQNPGITINYKTTAEPWLYDRASGMYELYLRSGSTTALREAIRASDFYVDRINASGFFTLSSGDPKYAYNESLAYSYWLLGDNRMLAPISTVVNAHNGTTSRWTPTLNFWTERNVGYKLLANEVAYEVTGSSTFKTNVQTIVNDLVWHQNGAAGQLPAGRVDGGLYHTGQQHDISEASSASVLIASSWMSALVVDPMVRVFGVWQNNAQVSDFIIRMGNFEKAASKTDSSGDFGGATRYPDYLMRTDGTSDNRLSSDVQHAMDVGAVAAWATYFAELRGTPDASLRQLANDLYATYDVGVNFWTRPGGTNFNVSPPRRYTWEYKNSPSFSWALTGTDAVIAGDYNRNGTVDTADFVLYRKTLGQTGLTPFSGADGNGDGTISPADYAIWRSHFGSPGAAASAAPSPPNSQTTTATTTQPTPLSPTKTTTNNTPTYVPWQQRTNTAAPFNTSSTSTNTTQLAPTTTKTNTDRLLTLLAQNHLSSRPTAEQSDSQQSTPQRAPETQPRDTAFAAFDTDRTTCGTAVPSTRRARWALHLNSIVGDVSDADGGRPPSV